MSAEAAWESWETRLFTRIGDLRAEALDESTRQRAALVLVDDLAAMIVGSSEPEVRALAGASGRVAPQPESRMVTGGYAGRGWAAMVNGVAAVSHELDEGYRPATCHGGAYALPAAMAEIEANNDSLGKLFKALVAGYEASTAYARALPAPKPLIWHPHATLSPIGAAVAIAFAREGDQAFLTETARIASTLGTAGPFAHVTAGANVRNAWAGNGALAGFTAVELTTAGIISDRMSGIEVFAHGFGHELSMEELHAEHESWAIHDGYHKQYACCQYLHSAVEAAASAARRELAGIPISDIREITVETHPLAEPLCDTAPSTVLGAKFSLPHVIAAVFCAGNTEPATFGAEYLHREEVVRLRQRVTLETFTGAIEPPHDRPARLHITLRNGSTIVSECLSAVGGPDRPLSADDVLTKAAAITHQNAPRFADVAENLLLGKIPESTPWAELVAEIWS